MLRVTIVGLAVIGLAAVGCGGGSPRTQSTDGGAHDGSIDGAPDGRDGGTPDGTPMQPDAATAQTYALTVTAVDTTFVTEDHFIAAVEMQLSGEPFAEAMGRDLGGYTRDYACQDAACQASVYTDPSSSAGASVVDIPGYSAGVESYEYSKQPMNNIAFESGAGTSLLFGPVLNPTGAAGADALALAQSWFQHMAGGSFAGNYVLAPGAGNPLGWPGLWPVLQPFASWDPTIAPTNHAGTCLLTSDDNPGRHAALFSDDYECDYTTLNLPDRDAQVTKTIGPGSSGWTDWKEALWTLNYLQIMHNVKETEVDSVDDSVLEEVGIPGNDVTGTVEAGTYLGSSNIEGFQAQIFIDSIENRAEDWLMHFATTDGVNLSGFPSLLAALSYDYQQPLEWLPGQINVTETDDGSGFPRPSYTLGAANSSLLDQLGLLLGYSEFYALTDTSNADVGGSQPASVYFDGDPFASDNQLPDGESSLHDRALGMLRVTLINLDRLHVDAASGLLVDDVTMNGNVPQRGTTVSTTSVAYALLGLRTTARALSSQLELYSNNSPDTALGTTPLDSLPVNLPDPSVTFGQRLVQILQSQALLLLDHLTDATGRAFAGWDVARAAPTTSDDLLDAHTAAVRGLFAAYLATGDVRYRDRALLVFQRLERVFYDVSARIYTATPAPVASVEYTPLRFALLQSALRDMYELVASRPGGEALQPLLEAHVGRLNKLVLNGWDDRNQNRVVDYPDECVNVQGGLPRGGLQMAERSLTGETGSLAAQLDVDAGEQRVATSDREHDCVPEIDDAHLPAALADSVTFKISR